MLTIKMNDKESVSIMFNIQECILEKYLAISVTFMVCVIHLSTAAGQFAAGFALLFGVLLWKKRKEDFFVSEEIKEYMKAYGVFILLLVPSIIFSDNPVASIKEYLRIWIWRYVVFVVIAVFITRRDYLVSMLAAFLAVSSVDCLFTLVEVIKHIRPDGRGWGFNGPVLTLAGIMCMLLPIILVILMDSSFEKRLKEVASFAVVSVLVGLLCNKSRGAWLTELIVVPVATFRYLKQNKRYLIVVIALFLGIVGFMASNPTYVHRVKSITNTTTDGSNTGRIWTWKSAKEMVRDHPGTGVGIGRFRVKYIEKYKSEQEKQNLPHAHNNFLQVSAESGFIGLAGFLYFAAYYLYRSIQSYSKNKNPYDILYFTTFFGYICLFGQIEYSLGDSTGTRIMWFLLAVLLNLKETEGRYCET